MDNKWYGPISHRINVFQSNCILFLYSITPIIMIMICDVDDVDDDDD